MRATWLGAMCLLVLAILWGCVPQRVVWSPDGKQAAVMAKDGLRLCDAEGKISEVLVKDSGAVMAWLPDSKGLILSRKVDVKTWKEAAEWLTDGEKKEITDNATIVRAEILKYQGDWDQFVATMTPKLKFGDAPNPWVLILMYLRDEQGAGLPEKVGEKWKMVQEMKIDGMILQRYEIADGKAQEGAILYRGLTDIKAGRVSPKGTDLAFTTARQEGGKEAEEAMCLMVVPTDGSKPAMAVTPLATWYPDWSADSRNVVYLRADAATSEKGDQAALRAGWLCQMAVRDETGKLAATLPPEDKLARVPFEPLRRVRTMKDGRIMFSSREVKLPATPEEGTVGLFFAKRDGDQTKIERITSMEQDANLISPDYFEVSPDERYVALAENNGQVALLDLSSHKVMVLQEESMEKSLRTIPSWRNADELCYVEPIDKMAEGQRDARVILWSVSKKSRQVLSKNWPDAAVTEFLMFPPEKPAK